MGLCMKIEFAKSLSGHDKDEIYFIQSRDDTYARLVNGKKRTLDAPKRKNKKHIQIIKKIPLEVTDCLAPQLTDDAVRRAIRLYVTLCGGRNKNKEAAKQDQ